MSVKAIALLVDHTAQPNEAISASLRDMGFEVVKASDKKGALKLVADHTFDLILADITAADKKGIELIRQLRGTENGRFTPILAVADEPQPEIKQAGREAGVSGWMEKDADAGQIEKTIKKVCGL